MPNERTSAEPAFQPVLTGGNTSLEEEQGHHHQHELDDESK